MPDYLEREIHEMEQTAYKDYVEAEARLDMFDPRIIQLKYRWLGMLEIKRELIRKFSIVKEVDKTTMLNLQVQAEEAEEDMKTYKEYITRAIQNKKTDCETAEAISRYNKILFDKGFSKLAGAVKTISEINGIKNITG